MLGSFRLVLATMVVMNHLWSPTANQIGAHAVIAFFAISGYLMTAIIQKDYGLSLEGAKRFAVNRILRIYPTYLVFLGLTLIALALFPDQASYSTIFWPASASDWLRNIFLFDLISSKSVIVPPAWSLGVEVFFYLAMVAFLSRSASIIAIWLAGSVAVHVYLVATGASFAARYYPLHSASLFFAIGAATYFWRDKVAWLAAPPRVCLMILPVFCFWPMIVQAAGFDRFVMGYYGAFPLFYVMFVSIISARNVWSPTDDYLGKLAYPVFVSHFFAAWVVHILLPALPRLAFPYLVVCFVVTLALSALCIALVDDPVQRVRDQVRGTKRIIGRT